MRHDDHVNPGTPTDVWKQVLSGSPTSWVLFEHGTCVLLPAPEGDLAEQATELLRHYGPVHAGSPAADFGVMTLKDELGWVVTGHHDDVLTYVGPAEPQDGSNLGVGLCGRAKRHRDGTEPRVVHVEDKRELA